MVGTQYEAAVRGRNTQLVEGCLHREHVLGGHLDTAGGRVTLAGSCQYWGLGSVLLCAEGVCSLGELGIVDGV